MMAVYHFLDLHALGFHFFRQLRKVPVDLLHPETELVAGHRGLIQSIFAAQSTGMSTISAAL